MQEKIEIDLLKNIQHVNTQMCNEPTTPPPTSRQPPSVREQRKEAEVAHREAASNAEYERRVESILSNLHNAAKEAVTPRRLKFDDC